MKEPVYVSLIAIGRIRRSVEHGLRRLAVKRIVANGAAEFALEVCPLLFELFELFEFGADLTDPLGQLTETFQKLFNFHVGLSFRGLCLSLKSPESRLFGFVDPSRPVWTGQTRLSSEDVTLPDRKEGSKKKRGT